MQLPANLKFVRLSANTNAVINTATTHALLAALPGNQRYRVWAWGYAGVQNNAASVIRTFLSETATLYDSIVATGTASDSRTIPGGLAMTAATALTITSFGTVINQPFNAFVWYTEEGVV